MAVTETYVPPSPAPPLGVDSPDLRDADGAEDQPGSESVLGRGRESSTGREGSGSRRTFGSRFRSRSPFRTPPPIFLPLPTRPALPQVVPFEHSSGNESRSRSRSRSRSSQSSVRVPLPSAAAGPAPPPALAAGSRSRSPSQQSASPRPRAVSMRSQQVRRSSSPSPIRTLPDDYIPTLSQSGRIPLPPRGTPHLAYGDVEGEEEEGEDGDDDSADEESEHDVNVQPYVSPRRRRLNRRWPSPVNLASRPPLSSVTLTLDPSNPTPAANPASDEGDGGVGMGIPELMDVSDTSDEDDSDDDLDWGSHSDNRPDGAERDGDEDSEGDEDDDGGGGGGRGGRDVGRIRWSSVFGGRVGRPSPRASRDEGGQDEGGSSSNLNTLRSRASVASSTFSTLEASASSPAGGLHNPFRTFAPLHTRRFSPLSQPYLYPTSSTSASAFASVPSPFPSRLTARPALEVVQEPAPDSESDRDPDPGYNVHDDGHLDSSSPSTLASPRPPNEDADTGEGDTDAEMPELGDFSESESESEDGSRSEFAEAEDEEEHGREEAENESGEIDPTDRDLPFLDRSPLELRYEEGLDPLNSTRRESDSLYRFDPPTIPSRPSLDLLNPDLDVGSDITITRDMRSARAHILDRILTTSPLPLSAPNRSPISPPRLVAIRDSSDDEDEYLSASESSSTSEGNDDHTRSRPSRATFRTRNNPHIRIDTIFPPPEPSPSEDGANTPTPMPHLLSIRQASRDPRSLTRGPAHRMSFSLESIPSASASSSAPASISLTTLGQRVLRRQGELEQETQEVGTPTTPRPRRVPQRRGALLPIPSPPSLSLVTPSDLRDDASANAGDGEDGTTPTLTFREWLESERLLMRQALASVNRSTSARSQAPAQTSVAAPSADASVNAHVPVIASGGGMGDNLASTSVSAEDDGMGDGEAGTRWTSSLPNWLQVYAAIRDTEGGENTRLRVGPEGIVVSAVPSSAVSLPPGSAISPAHATSSASSPPWDLPSDPVSLMPRPRPRHHPTPDISIISLSPFDQSHLSPPHPPPDFGSTSTELHTQAPSIQRPAQDQGPGQEEVATHEWRNVGGSLLDSEDRFMEILRLEGADGMRAAAVTTSHLNADVSERSGMSRSSRDDGDEEAVADGEGVWHEGSRHAYGGDKDEDETGASDASGEGAEVVIEMPVGGGGFVGR
jgi:hypothetical protein